ncbi:hypothetical protein BgiBS90_031610 [Biomphalaria glabrata]|nr:hypothetical protein BgiBS90_031610 [Biomphalaria glabrata]
MSPTQLFRTSHAVVPSSPTSPCSSYLHAAVPTSPCSSSHISMQQFPHLHAAVPPSPCSSSPISMKQFPPPHAAHVSQGTADTVWDQRSYIPTVMFRK